MKIIKENSKFENVFPMRITCKQVKDRYGFTYGDVVDFCGSELEVEAEDIKKHNWDKYPCYSGTDYIVVCPVCKQFILIDEKLLPQKVKDNAEAVRCADYR